MSGWEDKEQIDFNSKNFKDDYEGRLNLVGKEFVTTVFNPLNDNDMILILGDNIDGQKEGLTYLFLYLSLSGEIEHGIESLAFNSPNEAWQFIDKLPEMTALEFMFKTLGVRPGYPYK